MRETDHLEDPGVDGRIIVIRWIFRKWDGGEHGLDSSGSGQGQVAGNGPSGTIKCEEFLD
jgi:hypothetical protein